MYMVTITSVSPQGCVQLACTRQHTLETYTIIRHLRYHTLFTKLFFHCKFDNILMKHFSKHSKLHYTFGVLDGLNPAEFCKMFPFCQSGLVNTSPALTLANVVSTESSLSVIQNIKFQHWHNFRYYGIFQKYLKLQTIYMCGVNWKKRVNYEYFVLIW